MPVDAVERPIGHPQLRPLPHEPSPQRHVCPRLENVFRLLKQLHCFFQNICGIVFGTALAGNAHGVSGFIPFRDSRGRRSFLWAHHSMR